MPAARSESAITGSPSSTTTQRSTEAAKARARSIGSGLTSPILRKLAPGRGLGGVQVRDAAGDDARGVPARRGSTRFNAHSSPQAAISASLARSRRWAGRALAGIITRPEMSCSKCGARGGAASRPPAAGSAGPGDHDGLGVADAGGHPVEDRDLPPFRDFDRRKEEVVGLLRVGRLDRRQPGRDGVAAVVLLVLRGGHARVVGADHDQRAGHAGVGGGEERIGGDVEADVLHRHDRSRARERRAQADLEGHLLVGRPLGAAAQLRERLEDLRGRSAGIAGAQGDAGVRAASATASSPERSCRSMCLFSPLARHVAGRRARASRPSGEPAAGGSGVFVAASRLVHIRG